MKKYEPPCLLGILLASIMLVAGAPVKIAVLAFAIAVSGGRLLGWYLDVFS